MNANESQISIQVQWIAPGVAWDGYTVIPLSKAVVSSLCLENGLSPFFSAFLEYIGLMPYEFSFSLV
jgi:hypothetical protein